MIKNCNIEFPLKESYIPKYYIIDATNQTLGRLCTLASKLLRGKENSFYTPGIDLGNFVIIINSNKVKLSGKKETQKIYYRQSQRPGSLKKETFLELNSRISPRIIEKAIYGMLPKNNLGKIYYRRLFVYTQDTLEMNKYQPNYNHLESNSYIFLKNT
jgi:large subunit ribosomal protein L13